MKLVCFPNNAAGGFVCDLLNNKQSAMVGYKTVGSEHSLFKISDTPTVQFSIDTDKWNQRVAEWKLLDLWVGTHAHPTAIPNLTEFDKIIAITTQSRLSKLYRWLRYYHGWFLTEYPNWIENEELDTIDKIRELAKNVFVEFSPVAGCINIELEDIINGIFVTSYKLDQEYFLKWLQANPWLNIDSETWAIKRFNEAEWELQNNQPYKYI
jgi:hypothetical protein